MTDGPLSEGPQTGEPAAVDLRVDGPLPGAESSGERYGLQGWTDPVELGAAFWVAPPGSSATLRVTGGGNDAAELQWSVRCAEVPATRAVVFLDGPGFEDAAEDFTFTHRVAEDVAAFATARSETAAGPIEVLVFRPDTGTTPWPEPSTTPGGVEFHFPHRGGADVHLVLTLPTPPGEA
ncbi:MAG: hypothetical protein V7706_07610 [Dietzia psychralcaliphila]